LIPEVEIALQSVEHVTELARNLHNANYGELKIVAPPSFLEGVLSSVVSSFIRQYPQVSISLDSHGVETALKMIALRAVDCGFTKLPIEYPGLTSEPLLEAGTVCVLPAGHALGPRAEITVEDLYQQPLILLGKGRSFRRDIEQAFAQRKISMQICVETHTVGSACALVRGNIGIAIVNEILARQYAGDALVLRPFRPDIRHQYAFVTSNHAPMTRITRQFVGGRRDQKMIKRKPKVVTKLTSVQNLIPPSPKVQAGISLVFILLLLSTPGPVIEWLKLMIALPVRPPSASAFPTDKVVHCMMFAVSGFLVCRAWLSTRGAMAIIAMLLAYAGLTEVIQMMVPGRSGSVMDWLADAVGILLGVWWYKRLGQKA